MRRPLRTTPPININPRTSTRPPAPLDTPLAVPSTGHQADLTPGPPHPSHARCPRETAAQGASVGEGTQSLLFWSTSARSISMKGLFHHPPHGRPILPPLQHTLVTSPSQPHMPPQDTESSPSACQQALGPITPTQPYPPRPTHSHQVQLWHEHAIHRLALLVPQRLSDANPPRNLGQITVHHTL
jgi:hypothetical protein